MPRTFFDFATGNDGWRTWDANTGTYQSGQLFYDSTNQNIFTVDEDVPGENPVLVTPASFAGDQSDLIGGVFSFDWTNTNPTPSGGDLISGTTVLIRAADGTTLTSTQSFPATSASVVGGSATFNLTAADFGVSDAVFEAVMADVEFFGISSDVRLGDEIMAIDNVLFDEFVVDGEDSAENMAFGYDDSNLPTDGGGDQITTGDDSIRGNGGNDTVDGDQGNDSIDGGEGNDLIFGSDGADSLIGGEGDDTINTFFGTVSGHEAHGDTATSADTVNGGDGDDLVLGGFGIGESIDGGADNDTLSFEFLGSASAVDINLEDGTYTLGTGGSGTVANVENVTGTFGDDRITGDGEDNVLDGGPAGADLLIGRDGSDTLSGGDENDTLAGGAGDDSLSGGDGEDSLAGGSGSDTIVGGDGDDDITGDNFDFGNEIFNGDFALGTAGWTLVDGNSDGFLPAFNGDGLSFNANDRPAGDAIQQSFIAQVGVEHTISLDLIEANGGVANHTFRIDLLDDSGTVLASETHTAFDNSTNSVSFEFTPTTNVTTLVITNTATTNTVSTDGAIDNIVIVPTDLAHGDDSLDGGAGNDLILGGGGDDTLLGGADQDTLTGEDGNDQIEGGDGDDSISGNAGNDSLSGGAGDDRIFGHEDDDTIDGGEGADFVIAGEGNDQITVDQGDTVSGGDGDDYFTLVDLDTSGTGNDAISIFGGEGAETAGDTLQLTSDIALADITFTNTDDNADGLSGHFTMLDGTVVTFSQIENIICFTTGTLILTETGERPIESIEVGDRIITRDNGLQRVRWIGKRTVPGIGKFAPIIIDDERYVGANRQLRVSPQHRMLIQSYQADLLFGESEVLVAAKHMLGSDGVRREECAAVTYVHMLFDRHEVIYAEGAATESFHVGDMSLEALENPARDEVFELFPELRVSPDSMGHTARLCLKPFEFNVLRESL